MSNCNILGLLLHEEFQKKFCHHMEMDHNILVQLVLLSQVLILLLFFKVVLRLENQAITKPTIWNDKIFAVNSRYMIINLIP